MEENRVKVVILTDLLDSRARKEKELAFYNEQLRDLQIKMAWVRHEIDLTTTIIDMIEKEKILDFQEYLKNKRES